MAFDHYGARVHPAPISYAPPRCPKGEHEITLYPEWANEEPVVCHFEYSPGEAQTLEYPGCPEELNLLAAYIRGWDCYRLLDKKQIAEMEGEIGGKFEKPEEPDYAELYDARESRATGGAS